MIARSWYQIGGDPTLSGWLTAFAFVGAAALCALVAWQAERIFLGRRVSYHRLVWVVFSFGLLFLGINKQLDLQTTFTQFLKEIAWRQGWYAFGQQLQVLFIAGMIIVGLGFLVGLGWILRHSWKRYWILLLGLLFITRFVIVRAAGFYGVYLPPLSQFTSGIRLNWLLEPSAALLFALAAAYNLYHGQESPPATETSP